MIGCDIILGPPLWMISAFDTISILTIITKASQVKILSKEMTADFACRYWN
jgi:hypothetical protein